MSCPFHKSGYFSRLIQGPARHAADGLVRHGAGRVDQSVRGGARALQRGAARPDRGGHVAGLHPRRAPERRRRVVRPGAGVVRLFHRRLRQSGKRGLSLTARALVVYFVTRSSA